MVARKACPLCDFVAADDGDWREHLHSVHDWDPTGRPTYLGDALVAIGLGTIVFIWVMTLSICSTSRCNGPGVWSVFGPVALIGAIYVLVARPVQSFRSRARLRTARANDPHRRAMTSAARDRLRRIDVITSTTIPIAFAGVFLAVFLAQQNYWWSMAAFICLAIVLVAGIVRYWIRKQLLA